MITDLCKELFATKLIQSNGNSSGSPTGFSGRCILARLYKFEL